MDLVQITKWSSPMTNIKTMYYGEITYNIWLAIEYKRINFDNDRTLKIKTNRHNEIALFANDIGDKSKRG